MNMSRILEHFESEAQDYDQIISNIIPYYHEMIEALVSIIPFKSTGSFKLLDLGCGTGSIGLSVLKKFPYCSVTCLDYSENMLTEARKKLSHNKNVEFINSDFNTYKFTEDYNIIYSSLAIHHLTDDDKAKLIDRIYAHLKPGGLFFNADVVLSKREWVQSVNMSHWVDYMKRSVPENEIHDKWLPVYFSEDHPAVLTDQLEWMKKSGFKDVDVLWKYFNFAVYGGVKEIQID
jgi:tRNA (cmo5U34)-methyltransferase